MSVDRPLLLVVAAALIDAQGRILLAQRPPGKQLAGLWEFPGGKLEPGESPQAALVRELQEELAITANPDDLDAFSFASFSYPAFHLMMPLFLLHRWRGDPVAVEAAALAWVKPADISGFPMPPADVPLVHALQQRFRVSPSD
jgi:8-oxo-dGTP diphosphatase